ncbi:MAG: hypothetical protein NT168_17000 [Planctomycetota bacterium]|nr:hypothetical protein [Planctomycetota bacterium]
MTGVPMWCSEVATGAFLVFCIVVSGDIGDHWCSCLASDFVVLVLSEAVLSETVLVLDGCSNCGDVHR